MDQMPTAGPSKRKRAPSDDLNATQNLVHPEWETIDPTPDVQALFGAFDTKFFQGKLRCVQLEWSKKMYQCAGICYCRRNQMGSAITIRLSEPLLKLRQRMDLVETMLHEMIHAYLFVLKIREGNGGHGPNFKRIMVSINQTAGTNITVYHTFHDEVNLYKTHVWRCNGICQHRKPFFGYVKRTCNRAPGPSDQWWAQHHQTCGGHFAKTAEPEPKSRAPRAPTGKKTLPAVQRIDDPKWGMNSKARGAGSKTITLPPKTKPTKASTPNPKNSNPFAKETRPTSWDGNLRNVRGMNDLNSSGGSDNDNPGPSAPNRSAGGNLSNVVGFKDVGSNRVSHPNIQDLTGGHTLGSSTNHRSPHASPVNIVRDVWSNKFRDDAPPKKPRLSEVPNPSQRNGTTSNQQSSPNSSWHQIGDDSDDDVLIREVKEEIFDISDDDDDEVAPPPRIKPDPDARQRAIKSEILDDFDGSDIELIDDDFDDDYVTPPDASGAIAMADTSVIDDIFGTDTLIADFNEINDAMPDQASNDQIITCPICTERMCREMLEEHLNGCQGIKMAINKTGRVVASTSNGVFRKTAGGRGGGGRDRQLLAQCGYTKEEIEASLGKDDGDEEEQFNRRILREMSEEQRGVRRRSIKAAPATAAVDVPVEGDEELGDCPVCSARISLSRINNHLDVCLSVAVLAEDD